MDWLTTSPDAALRIVASTFGIYVIVILAIRLNGLRSLAKMSSFDFVISIAVGSIIAGTLLTSTPSLANGGIAIATVFLLQRAIAIWRQHGGTAVVDNDPVVLMIGAKMLDDVLERTRVTRADVRGKLREANVIDVDEVYVVILESTGDISVLHGSDGTTLDARLLDGVVGADEALAQLASRTREPA